MGECKKGCRVDCYNCLNHIHRYYNHTDHYSCEKITYNYLLKHGHRYASEIAKAISDIKPYLKPRQLSDYVSIISVGCGPSTELYGGIEALSDMNVHYTGIDRNPIWKNIQEFNVENFKGSKHKVQYSSIDFFEFVESTTVQIDILILNYFFSDFVKFNKSETDEFIAKLASLIQNGKFNWVIINDIPLFYDKDTGYICMERLSQKAISTKEYRIIISRRRFSEPNQFQPTYGKKIDHSLFFPIIEPDVIAFEPFASCNSIQQIISINKIQL